MTAEPGQFGRRRLRPPEQTANTPDLAEILAPGVGHDLPPVRMDTWRYLRVAWFFARMFLSVIWWDLFLRHMPGLRGVAQRNALPRWQAWAKRFRRLAVSQGGVLIKLGQFLSTRVDVLPSAVTDELKGLQDEVPSESLADIRELIAVEFGRPVEQVFSCFEPVPEAAASLAQVHRACLMDGATVVVKVQRPRIERLVATDLAAIRLAMRWLKWYRRIARRVDLDQLYAEFSATTRAELDFIAEGHNADRFAANFADDPGVYIADVFWEYTTRRVLTLENVASIKINDLAAINTAGISRPQLARKLYDTYLEQIFVHHFMHADPHPGNLFVHPLPPNPRGSRRLADAIPAHLRGFRHGRGDPGTPAEQPARSSHCSRHARPAPGGPGLSGAGVLLPGADLQRLEALHDSLFTQSAGCPWASWLAAMEQAEFVLGEYRDVIYEMPFQFPTDVLFAGGPWPCYRAWRRAWIRISIRGRRRCLLPNA